MGGFISSGATQLGQPQTSNINNSGTAVMNPFNQMPSPQGGFNQSTQSNFGSQVGLNKTSPMANINSGLLNYQPGNITNYGPGSGLAPSGMMPPPNMNQLGNPGFRMAQGGLNQQQMPSGLERMFGRLQMNDPRYQQSLQRMQRFNN